MQAKVTNKRFDGNWGNLYTRDLPHSNTFLLSEYHLFYLEVNLMPYGFLFMLQLVFYKVHSLSTDLNRKFVLRSVNGI